MTLPRKIQIPKMARRGLAVFVFFQIVSCGRSEPVAEIVNRASTESQQCNFFPSEHSIVTSEPDQDCDECSVQNESAAIDGDFESGATLSVPFSDPDTSGGGIAIRAVDQSGRYYPENTVIRYSLAVRSGSNWEFEFRMYRDQELVDVDSQGISRQPPYTLDFYVNVSRGEEINAMEVYARNHDSAGTNEVEVLELCPDVPTEDG